MQAYVAIGANCEFKLSEAVLVYRAGGGGTFGYSGYRERVET
jgi:hypothetical protein